MGESNFFDKETHSQDIWMKSFKPSLETNVKYFLDLSMEDDDIFDPQKIYFGYNPKEKLQIHIENCKKLLSQVNTESPVYKELVLKMIQLKFSLLNIEEKELNLEIKNYVINGHNFILKNKVFPNEKSCGKCNHIIIPLYHKIMECLNCRFVCHLKCSSSLHSHCVKSAIKAHPSYILAIKPETGLVNQDFKCADCKTCLDINKPTLNLNICDYTGFVYCDQCYRKDSVPIPARILHNWDFKARGVCKKSRHFLDLMRPKPVLSIVDINGTLFQNVPTLQRLSKLRRNMLYIKMYMTTCKAAIKNKMLLKLAHRQHFIENPDIYSIQDLIDLNNDILLPEFALIYNSFIIHIKRQCEICKGKGFICELCSLGTMIFPFDENVAVCPKCIAVYHSTCYDLSNRICPRCKRRLKKDDTKWN